MSSTESPSSGDTAPQMGTEIPVAVAKRRIGPIRERYQGGEFVSVETQSDGAKRVAVCGLDRSHSGDYKVTYASDPLIVVHAESAGFTHDQLHQKLLQCGIWTDDLRPIEVPTGEAEWLAGFASTPKASERFDWFADRITSAAVDDAPVRQQETTVSTYI